MPLGLTNALATLQRNMMNILGDLPGVFIYLDDILSCSNTKNKHACLLRLVFECLARYCIKLSLYKCEFFKTGLEYLRLLISDNGVRPNMSVEYARAT